MKRLFQIFGGGLGWSLGGPIGALLGVALGNMMHDLVARMVLSQAVQARNGHQGHSVKDRRVIFIFHY